jgi:tetratricopeptide (TPR) repeat protein
MNTELSGNRDQAIFPGFALSQRWETARGDRSGKTFRAQNSSYTILKHRMADGSFRSLRVKTNAGSHVLDSYILEGDFEGAIHLADSILEQNPDDVETLWRKAKCHSLLGEDDDAEAVYEHLLVIYDHLLEENPNNATYVNNKGAALSHLGRKKEALEYFERAYKLESGCLIITANLAGAYANDGQYDKGLKYAEKALTLDPNDEGAKATKAYCQWMMDPHPAESPEKTLAYLM